MADRARDAGEYDFAEKAYRALTRDTNPDYRNEARFRLAMMFADRLNRYRDAAVLLRQILDDKPDTPSVRIELARMQALLGNLGAAERELRQAESSKLPREVEQMVRFYAAAFNAKKPVGGSLEVALAPDSNVNRATRSDTLGTVLGDFTLDEDAKARSGLGVLVRGQTYFRAALNDRDSLLTRLSAYGSFYGRSAFDDHALSLQVGPEFVRQKSRFNLAADGGMRWFGLKPYSRTLGVSGGWQRAAGPKAQVRIDARLGTTDNRVNDLQDGAIGSAALSYDRAFQPSFGGGLQVSGSRENVRDDGYSTASGGLSGYVFREFRKTTVTATLGYSHLEADKRLLLYPKRRVENRYAVSLGANFRSLRVGSLAPTAKLSWERNRSSVEIWDYSRKTAEVGIAAAF